MESPNKMIGGIAGSMAERSGGATNLGAQPQQQEHKLQHLLNK